ncbi:MAG: hypothetical protein WHT63_00530 [Tepidiforma sp.]
MQIEYALLADHAEVLNGKLYLMGGGWDVRQAPAAPARAQFAVAIGVRVEWDETNVPIALQLRLEDDDGAAVFQLAGQLNVGRPPHVPAGSSQLIQAAVALNAELPAYGGYRAAVRASMPGGREDARALPFRLVPAPPGAAPAAPAG